VHRERPFFKDLVRFMTSGPVIVQVLEGEGAIAKNRDVMGATDPKKARPAPFARTSPEHRREHRARLRRADTAAREIAFFFREIEVCPRTR
jgi:nucleoside-diphosphate kinase